MPKDYNAADVAFVLAMLPHHAEAVDMALAYLDTAQNPAVRRMAQAIADGQEGEIATFRRWLKERGVSPRAIGDEMSSQRQEQM